MKRWLLTAGMILPMLSAHGWEKTGSRPVPAASGLSVEVQQWNDPAAGEAEVHVVGFQPQTHRLRVIDQGLEGGASLSETMARTNGLAGINGGYFHPDRKPLGLVIAGGVPVHAQEKARLLSGLVLVAGNGGMRLARPTEPRPKTPEVDALQAGPFLVDGGVAVPGLEATRRARRSIVLVEASGRWALVATSRLTLAEAAALLAARTPKVVRALNLDGGSSTALWARGTGATPAVDLREFGSVRNFLAIVPR